MSLDDKLKNYAKYQLDYERSNALQGPALVIAHHYSCCSTHSYLRIGHMKQVCCPKE